MTFSTPGKLNPPAPIGPTTPASVPNTDVPVDDDDAPVVA